ncbi:hypothetical protein JZ751_002054 [Albula glossodonta]|uniref:Schwannomin interacting protein 1 n=1 Tax=Albula glossodonta TaxID=121402 RepID=A0A8T2P7U6_9TELE|nr:hypothetical protein JZ751_002054 [Albula glossodonta]
MIPGWLYSVEGVPNAKFSDYREDGMDLGSDASSRSSSESNSNKVTPCSEYKSSPSLDLATLEDYEEDEDYQEYKKKVLEEWESEYGDYSEQVEDGDGYRKPGNSRSLAEEFQDVKTPPPPLIGHAATVAAAVPEELKQNGNIIIPSNHLHYLPPLQGGVKTVPKPGLQVERVSRGGTGGHGSFRRGVEEPVTGSGVSPPAEEPQLPTMDWAALEKHLAGLQCREQEVNNQNQSQGRSYYTSHGYVKQEKTMLTVL